MSPSETYGFRPQTLLILLIFMGSHLLEAVYICPAHTECFCFFNKEIDCLDFELREVPYFDPENITFDIIDLSQNRFNELKANAFKNLRVRRITLKTNRKSMTIHKDALSDVGEYLEYLELTKNKEIPTLPSGIFRHAKKLKALDLQRNHMQKLPPFAFKGATSVQRIDIQRNDIAHIPDHTFRGLVSLKELDISENNISSLGAKAFLGMRSLENLYLDQNRIRDLQPKAFRRLDSLRILDLSNNVISALFPIMFKGLRELEILDFTNNPIELIADNTFASMQSLTELIIDKAKLRYLRPGMFRGLENLRELSLNHNDIQVIDDEQFKTLPNLWKLYLGYNQLYTINPCAFNDIDKMKSISAYGNPIHCDCSMSWVVDDSSPEVIGRCASPETEVKLDIELEQRYRVCTFSGLERCSLVDDAETNESLRMWLRYRRRVYRHAPVVANG